MEYLGPAVWLKTSVGASKTESSSAIIRSWRTTYDAPYRSQTGQPAGSADLPILIVGAGTGNDVSAALRAGSRAIDAVEIDPTIVQLGRWAHPEQPYADPRVRVIVDDARSFFAKTPRRYGKAIFGFLDSHTLMSSFSSLRLDNFVYTRESMERVKALLVPGGMVAVTFAAHTTWLHERMIALLDSVFDAPTLVLSQTDGPRYSNGIVYLNWKASQTGPAGPPQALRSGAQTSTLLPTDDWPFLYLQHRTVPVHYRVFMAMVMLMGLGGLWLLPSGERRVKAPYFLMGAAFFLIETSNVVALSLLYGSTWMVNTAVFAGILVLILLGNLTAMRRSGTSVLGLFILLWVGLGISYIVRPAMLLGIEPWWLKGVAAVVVFLGPVYLASVIFAQLIKRETHLAQAYGSNLLGAVMGGACEYLSMVMGLRWLLLLTSAFYVLAFVSLLPSRKAGRLA